MLFPGLINKKFCQINLNTESIKWRKRHPDMFDKKGENPFLDPDISQKLIDDIHQELSVDWSYGGYLEDRSDIWAGSYLDKNRNYLHLGIDFNVPKGTAVAVDYDSKILIVDDDNDMDGGWGPRVILKPYFHQEESAGSERPVGPVGQVRQVQPVRSAAAIKSFFLIFSHLQNIRCRQGDLLKAGDILADVGGPPYNGNWPPHLHVQAVIEKYLVELITVDIYSLDGYGKSDEIENLKELFPNPIESVRLE